MASAQRYRGDMKESEKLGESFREDNSWFCIFPDGSILTVHPDAKKMSWYPNARPFWQELYDCLNSGEEGHVNTLALAEVRKNLNESGNTSFREALHGFTANRVKK